MIVVYAATRNLYPYLKVTISSLLAFHKDARVIVLAEDDDIGLPVEVINVSSQNYYRADGINSDSIFTYMAAMRLLYVDLLPNIDRVIQLDVDTIVCDSILPLWEMDLTGKWFAACREWNGRYRPFGTDKYYNVGVAVFNLKQMREDGKVPEMVDWLNTHRAWTLEQDVLNLYGVDKIVDIPPRYNENQFTDLSNNPAIVHYAGYPKWFEANPRMTQVDYLLRAREKFSEL